MKPGVLKILPVVVISAAVLLMASLSCSDGKDRPIALLEKADSLMADNPQSALDVLYTIGTGTNSTMNRYERAYYVVLMTEAEYRCGMPVLRSSEVSEAVRYFRSSIRKSLYARALMMQGAVYQEMSDTILAIETWLEAMPGLEKARDYGSLGMLHRMLGDMCSLVYKDDPVVMGEYAAALANSELAGNSRDIMRASFALAGELLCDTLEQASVHIMRGMDIAKEYGDREAMLMGYGLLTRQYNLQKEFVRTLDCVREAYAECGDIIGSGTSPNLLAGIRLNQAEAYASLGLSDSAKSVLSSIGPLPAPEDSVRLYRIRENIARNMLDLQAAESESEAGTALSGRLDSAAFRKQMRITGLLLENENLKCQARETRSRMLNMAVCLIAVLLVASGLVLVLYLRNRRLKRENSALKDSIRTFDIPEWTAKEFRTEDIAGPEINAILHDMVALIGEMNEACAKGEKDASGSIRKMLDRYFPENEVHVRIRRICDLLYPGVLSGIETGYPSLTANDILLIALMACRFPTGAICAIRRLNVHSLNVQKTRTARKIAPDVRLSDFIAQNFPEK